MSTPFIEIQGLKCHYSKPRKSLWQRPEKIYALDGIDLTIYAGEGFGVVGESGCGKSTLARLVMALQRPTAGPVRIMGQDLAALDRKSLRALRPKLQMIFQDPYGSLDPRLRVHRIVSEPLDAAAPGIDRHERRKRVTKVLESAGLKSGDASRYPHEFSGGQRQRISIARALITTPSLIVADEPVSALDVSVQAQVLNLLLDLKQEYELTYLFISHDLAVVEYVCERTAVMYLGKIVEQTATSILFSRPLHPYTRALMDAVPRPMQHRGRRGNRLAGEATLEYTAMTGCSFAYRCPYVQRRCHVETPELREVRPGHLVACHFGGTL